MNRQEAIDILSTHYEPDDQRLEQALDMAIEALKESHWIPCSERLPEVGKYVLTCISEFEDGCMGIDFLEKHIDGLHWMNDHGDLTDLEAITAWLPLPEPYREEGE